MLKKGHTPPYTSVYLQYGKERQVKLRIGTDHLFRFKNMAWEYFDKEMKLTPFGFANFEQFQSKAASIDPDFRCYEDALEFILESREKEQRHGWIDLPEHPSKTNLKISIPLFSLLIRLNWDPIISSLTIIR